MKPISRWRLLGSSIVFLVSCSHAPDIAGKWKEAGKTSTLELRRDGTFHAVDDLGMAVSGTYTLKPDGSIRFDIRHEDASREIIDARAAVEGDALTFTFPDRKGAETYRRSP